MAAFDRSPRTKADGSAGTDSGIGPGAGAEGCGSASFTGGGGDGGVISAPHVAEYNPSGSFTVEAWIYPTALPSPAGLATIMAHEGTTPTNRSWSFGLDYNGHIELVASYDGSTLQAAVSAKTVPLNAWSFVVGAYDSHGTTTWVWVDGQNYGKGNASQINATTAPLTIGNASDNNSPFTGRIEEARYSTGFLYPIDGSPYAGDARLSASASTLALFHFDDTGATVHDSSPRANNATVYGDATLAAECAPGVCNWVHLPAGGTVHVPPPTPNVLSPAHSFTLEGWFRSYNASGTVIDHGGAYGFGVSNPQNQVQFQFTCAGTGGGPQTTLTSTQQVVTYVWHHWAAVFDAVNMVVTLFIDGVESASSSTGCAASYAQSGVGLDIVGSVFDVSEVRLSNDVRYDASADAGFAPEKHAVRFTTDPDTIALYHFDEIDGGVAHDSSGTFTDGGLNGYLITGTQNGATAPTFGQCQ